MTIELVKGWFNEALPSYVEQVKSESNGQIVLDLDADSYSSTYYVFAQS